MFEVNAFGANRNEVSGAILNEAKEHSKSLDGQTCYCNISAPSEVY